MRVILNHQLRFKTAALFIAAGWLVFCEPVCSLAANLGHHADPGHKHQAAASQSDHHHDRHHWHHVEAEAELDTAAQLTAFSADHQCCGFEIAPPPSHDHGAAPLKHFLAIATVQRQTTVAAANADLGRGPPPDIVLARIPFKNFDALLI